MSAVRPAPVAIFTARGNRQEMLYVLAPGPKGAPDPLESVAALGGDPRAARVKFADGRIYEVRFAGGKAEARQLH
jgi:hypothetical protein